VAACMVALWCLVVMTCCTCCDWLTEAAGFMLQQTFLVTLPQNLPKHWTFWLGLVGHWLEYSNQGGQPVQPMINQGTQNRSLLVF